MKYCSILHLLTRLTLSLPLLAALPASGQTLNEDAKLTASDAAAGNQFGVSVAISGTTAVVGAHLDDELGQNSGSAYVFDVSNPLGVIQIAKLTAADATAFDQFGISVALSGTTAIIGANDEDDAGSVYVFDITTGQQLFKLTASDAAASDFFGTSVAISGTTAIIGASGDDDAGSLSGSAYIFDTTTGQQLFKLTASDAAASDRFGSSVSISGTTAVIGAYQDDDGGTNSGSAYVFDTTTGQQLFKLTASDAAANDWFGDSVSISGTTAIIGAYQDDDGGSNSGAAYVFNTITGQQLFKLTAADAAADDQFGESVAISGTTAIIGATWDNDAGNRTGSAYLFDTATGQQLFKLTASDAASISAFGNSVAISNGMAIVGAFFDDSAGSAYLFVGTPPIVQQPEDRIVMPGETATFEMLVAHYDSGAYLWRRNGVELVDGGNISGATTLSLQIVAQESDIATYDCVITGPWGPLVSIPVVLGVLPDPNACTADLNGDGVLNFFDVSVFLSVYGAGCP